MNLLTAGIANGSAWVLILAVAVVGVLHTIVPDHWVPITLIARERKWTRGQTARAAFMAGVGHVVTTLILGGIVWLAGVAVATRFGHAVDLISSLALISFGLWIAIGSLRDMRKGSGHGHSHSHDLPHDELSIHGPELEKIETTRGVMELSIFEHDMPPCFRISGIAADNISIETVRPDGSRQTFLMSNMGQYWQSDSATPEPHEFAVEVSVIKDEKKETYEALFVEHAHSHGHVHEQKKNRTALLLILGSSPMVEGIPAFFAAGKYGIGVITIMAFVFAIATISTYVLLSVYSAAGLKRMNLRAFEEYGEVISGFFIALIGLVFFLFPVI